MFVYISNIDIQKAHALFIFTPHFFSHFSLFFLGFTLGIPTKNDFVQVLVIKEIRTQPPNSIFHWSIRVYVKDLCCHTQSNALIICYGLALLPSNICLGRSRIASISDYCVRESTLWLSG